MNFLVKHLVESVKGRTIAVFGGGFKPPTKGHFSVVKQALEENPSISEFRIYVGTGERDGISQSQSVLIWEIYSKYLPFKVKIIPSEKAPIRAIYNTAKENPQDEVLWVIGAREGNEEDFSDIAKRTTSLNKYPNLELRTIVSKSGISGTAARNAMKADPNKLFGFLPDELSDEEKQEVLNILSSSPINEVTDSELKDFFQDSNELFGDIKLYYGKHFQSRVNRSDNSFRITKQQLNRFLDAIKNNKDTILNRLKSLKKVKDGEDASKESLVLFDPYTDINMAVVKIDNPNDPSDENSFAATTIKKQSDFQSKGGRKYIMESVENINYKQKIVELTKHMLDQGKNIKPLPKVVFKNDEAESEDFFGKTAYYQPQTQTIVLYVKDRHPKDIVRSFSHEMIHHMQNIEDRLGRVTTTDTNEDDHLDKLEREAYLDGNMTFRNWTDSVIGTQMNEKKDPFGLTAYARELALLREDEGEYKVYLDMDGVVADFNKRFEDLAGMSSNEFEAKYGKTAFWDFIDEGDNKIKFWVGIPPMPNADKLVSYINSNFDYEMLTAPSQKKQSLIGKTVWIKKWTNKGLFPSKPKINFKAAKNKHKIKDELTKFDILIDDKASTIDTWNEAGGTGILYLNAEQVIKELENVKKGI